ncbi:phage virion morphogenesis protein [Rhizobium sp. 11_C7_N12_5]|uniref:phage virion morphogenesis protein n=1 Tax=Rhizobium sp. 11_C7_N12_5 TaxID=3240770 RepID=UPI003F20300C
MAGTTITYKVSIQDAALSAELDALARRSENRRTFYVQVGEYMLNSTSDSFEKERTPDGQPWKTLMPATIKRREEKRQTPIKILRASGRLAGSINYRASNDDMTIGSPLPYAAIHNNGGEIEMPERTQTIYQHYDEKNDEIDQRFRKKSKSNFARDVLVKAHSITMPARTYLDISKENEKDIIQIGREWLRGENTSPN